MINRGNWLLTKKYLRYREEVHQLAPSSVSLEKRWLHHVLEWAGPTPFSEAPRIRPLLQQYIQSARLDGSSDKLSEAYTRKIIGAARKFLSWLVVNVEGHSDIPSGWIETLRTPRRIQMSREFRAITFEEVLEIAKSPATTLEERRIKAAACFWYLSGIRVGAFVTLPIATIDLETLSIKQWPELGVKTKFRKRATTYLLDIPELLKAVKDWDREVRNVLPDNSLWFAPIDPVTGKLVATLRATISRASRARKSLKAWLTRIGLSYHNPHSFRHGHAVYAIQNAANLGDLKAISMNLMHSNLQITDGVYGILSSKDVKERVTSLSRHDTGKNLDVIPLLEMALQRLNEEEKNNS